MSQMVGEAADALASPIRGLPGRLGFGDVEDADRVGRFTSVQRHSAPVVLAAVPWWIVGGAMMRAGFGDAVYFTGRDTPEVTVALGAVLIAIGALVTWVTRGASRRLDLAALRHWRQGVLALAVATFSLTDLASALNSSGGSATSGSPFSPPI